MAFGDLIQQIAMLSQLKNQREQLVLQQNADKREGQAQQFNQIQTLANNLLNAPTGVREQIIAATRAGKILPDDVIDQVSSALPSVHGDPIQWISRTFANEGAATMTPSQRARTATEAANLAATGQSRAETAKSGVMAGLLQNGSLDDLERTFGSEMVKSWQRSITETVASGQPVGTAAIQRRLANSPDLIGTAAAIQAGAAPSAGERLSASVSMEGIRSNNMIAAGNQALEQRQLEIQAAAARSKLGLTPSDQLEAMNQARQILDSMAGKNVTNNKAAQQYYAALLNQYLPLVGLPPLQLDDQLPARLTGLSRLFSGVVGQNQGLQMAPAPGGGR